MTVGSNSRGGQRSGPTYREGGSASVNGRVVRCKCGVEAKVRISRTNLNPGKPWYGCHLPKNHPQNCNYFLWVRDEEDGITEVTSSREEEIMQLKAILLKNQAMIEELRVKNEAVIEGIMVLNQAMMVKNERVTQELRMLRVSVLGLVLMLVIVFFLLLYSGSVHFLGS
ncbi:uncharacterized protein LOC130735751 [Lotus japonicus]|uniref:uncharacterized protein LOC130714057 n=1 Tax=Lotus japonicus TaxID=34305 RepID=UPI0025910B9D|nr:uncharacterized protein LOC130714057 [Lotus japonicus]XP_057421496.1 uncharacterized protein LOC130715415 [Lotus japonicus]XP_057440093.1 uncharacterized protein LOC130731954 [Lotus japonicus]XP_057440440.1 uncharacterized protein LOC130732402 [Lotus japonicus]XP_057443632.1 uncharacterized protein LOC130735751 [Lotus japonicus]